MTRRMKESLIVSAGCALCAVVLIGIGLRFGTVKTLPSDEVTDSTPESNVVVEIENEAEGEASVNGAVDTGTEQTIQGDPVKPDEPDVPDTAYTKDYEENISEAEKNNPTPPTYEEPIESKPTNNEPAGGSVNDAGQVYVPGFGWVTSEGENTRNVNEDIRQNGNKVGIM